MNEDLDILIKAKLELSGQITKLKDEEALLKEKILLTMGDVDSYMDGDENIVSYREQSRETLQKAKVKNFLNEEQYGMCIKVSNFKVLRVTTKAQREMVKKFKK